MKVAHLLQGAACIVVFMVQNVTLITLEVGLTLTQEEKVKLDKFRDLVSPHLPHEYMKEDVYLLKWLKVNHFNIPASEAMILEDVKWRDENKMDNILIEDWSDFRNEYKIHVEGCDGDGRPIVSTILGDWDIRKAVVAGKMKRMMRYTDKVLEETTVLIRQLQKEGHNITQFREIYDLSNFNLVTHMCTQCMKVYQHNAQSYEKHYPLGTHNTMFVNAPRIFHRLREILRPVVAKEDHISVTFYGRDKRDWKLALREEFGGDNLSKNFGGDKEEAWDIEDIRRDPSIFKCNRKM